MPAFKVTPLEECEHYKKLKRQNRKRRRVHFIPVYSPSIKCNILKKVTEKQLIAYRTTLDLMRLDNSQESQVSE